MIHVGLHGDDRILGMTVSVPQVPAKNEFIRIRDELYRVERVTWLADPTSYVQVILELELDHHIS
jgi:hypothetical protein